MKFAANFSKKMFFFKFAPKRWSTVLFPQKIAFFYNNTFLPLKSCESLREKAHFLGIKQLTSVLVQT